MSAAVLLAAACGRPPAPAPGPSDIVTTVSVSPPAVTLDPGGTIKLTAEPRRADGSIVEGATVVWTSSSGDTAGVTADGTVTGRAGGVASVAATVNGVTNAATITVRDVYDLDARGVPAIVTAHYVDAGVIQRVSRFRSGIGHDYADSRETCRSMKHYFMPRADVDWTSVVVSSPVDGTVSVLQQEQTFGTQVQIRSSALTAATVVLFHVVVDGGITVGSRVSAGQRLGRHVGSQTMSDVAVRIETPAGFRFVSYFDAMTDALFSTFQGLGTGSRAAFVITAGERDSAPLTCTGEQFGGPGLLPNWVDLR